jgi:hypothetical protein
VGTEVRPPDLELWATTYTRLLLVARTPMAGYPDWDLADVAVGNTEPTGDEFPRAAVVFRDDGGQRRSTVSWERALGVSVLAGTRTHDAPARDLAFMLMGALTDESLPILAGRGCPVASVDGSNGPYRVDERQDRTRIYFTVDYTVFGVPVV